MICGRTIRREDVFRHGFSSATMSGCLGGGLVIRQTGLPICLNNMYEPYVRFKSVA